MLALLHCPECRVKVVPTPDGNGLRCDRCRRVFPIRDEIPIMLLEEAQREGEAD